MRPVSAAPQIEFERREKAEITAMKVVVVMAVMVAIMVMEVVIMMVVIPIRQRRHGQRGKNRDR
jgi:hypothetical protein